MRRGDERAGGVPFRYHDWDVSPHIEFSSCPCGRDLLVYVARRDEEFCNGNRVVGEEKDPRQNDE